MSTLSLLIVCSLSLVSAFSPSSRYVTKSAYNVKRTLSVLSEAKDDIAADKLIFDTKSGRFYEAKIEEMCEEEFCLIDTDNGKSILLTREEKERIFLDSIQSYYFKGQNGLSDIQFDKLRSDLSWEGSELVNLNRNETLFMNAMQAYNKGTPILSDPQFDELKLSLRNTNSKIAVSSEPKCYVDSGVCKVTWAPDTLRTTSLYVPATLLASILWIGVTYEIGALFDAHLNPLILLAVGSVPIASVSKKITENFFFKDPFVAKGACPSCGAENKIFFGSVVGIDGDTDESSVKCTNCKTSMTVKRETLRVSTLLKKAAPAAKAYDGKSAKESVAEE